MAIATATQSNDISHLHRDINDDFLAFQRHVVNGTLKSLKEYIRSNLQSHNLSHAMLARVDGFATQLWEGRDRSLTPKLGAGYRV